MTEIVQIDGHSLTLEKLVQVAYHGAPVRLSPDAKERIIANRRTLESLVTAGHAIYGVNTGVGEEADKLIHVGELRDMQESLIVSHATGLGESLPESVVRAMMLLRANALASGYSGVRLVAVEHLLQLLNRAVYPYVPAKGSVGASGDLAPNSHIALVLIGKGHAWVDGKLISGGEVLKRGCIQPLVLESKEGLALINGTDMMTAIGALVVRDTEMLLKTTDVIAAMSLDALRGKLEAFRHDVQTLRPHRGQMAVAANILDLLCESQLISKPRAMVQDAYTLRCIPQVHGASRDAFDYVKQVVETEINSVTDNPLVFTEAAEVVCAGHFHGQPLAIAMDVLGIALAGISGFSERRVHRLIETTLSEGLPARLSPLALERPGFYTGFSMAHETASALVSENKILAHPASVDSIPGLQEDYVSMGATAARKTSEILGNAEYCLAIELLSAAQALDLRYPLRGGVGTEAARVAVRQHIAQLVEDRELHDDLVKGRDLIRKGVILKAVETKLGHSLR